MKNHLKGWWYVYALVMALGVMLAVFDPVAGALLVMGIFFVAAILGFLGGVIGLTGGFIKPGVILMLIGGIASVSLYAFITYTEIGVRAMAALTNR